MSNLLKPAIFELNIPKYPNIPNFIKVGASEATIEDGRFQPRIASWRPFWNSRWRSIRSLGSGHCWTQHPKIPLYAKFHWCGLFRSNDIGFQLVIVAAILKFKMAANPLFRSLGSGHCWSQHPKIPLHAKFHWCGCFRSNDIGLQPVIMAAILKIQDGGRPVGQTSWIRQFLNSTHKNTPITKISHFLPEVNTYFTYLPDYLRPSWYKEANLDLFAPK